MADVRALLRLEIAARNEAPTSKKRKAVDDFQASDAGNKKSKAHKPGSGVVGKTASRPPARKRQSYVASPPDLATVPEESGDQDGDEQDAEDVKTPDEERPTSAFVPDGVARPVQDVDETEWAAYKEDMARMEEESKRSTLSALTAPAAIQASAVRAGEQSTDRQQDMSDAAAHLEDDEKAESKERLIEEFEAMSSLGERLARLKEQRQALKNATQQATADRRNDPGNEKPATSENIATRRAIPNAYNGDDKQSNTDDSVGKTPQISDNHKDDKAEAANEDEDDDEDDENEWIWGLPRR